MKKSPPLVANKWYPYSQNRSAGNESLICPLPRYSFDAHFKDKAENKRPLTSMFFRMPGKSEKVWVSLISPKASRVGTDSLEDPLPGSLCYLRGIIVL